MRTSTVWQTALVCAAVGLGGCGAPAERPGAAGDTQVDPSALVAQCEDGDGDGYGPQCVLGADCDDNDPRITDQCYRCLLPNEGCMCRPGTLPVACDVHTGAQVTPQTCNLGQRNCVDGSWTACLTYHRPFGE